MNQSESIAKLSEALAKAQGIMEGAAKENSNPFFKSKYADLSSVWNACRKPLSDNGLSVVQTADFITEHPELVCIETILCHSSGEWIKGRLAVKPVKSDPQSVGSCITYLRRYSLQSMVGIAPEDDDGNAASGQGEPSKREYKKKTEPAPPFPNTEPDVPEYPEFEKSLASKEQVTKIQILMKENGISQRESILEELTAFCGRIIKSSKDLTKDEASDWISANEKAA